MIVLSPLAQVRLASTSLVVTQVASLCWFVWDDPTPRHFTVAWLSSRPLSSIIVMIAVAMTLYLPRFLEQRGRIPTRQHAWLSVYFTGMIYTSLNIFYLFYNGIFQVAVSGGYQS